MATNVVLTEKEVPVEVVVAVVINEVKGKD